MVKFLKVGYAGSAARGVKQKPGERPAAGLDELAGSAMYALARPSRLPVLSFSFSLQPGKVVILLTGRHAGKKAVIVKNFDDGTSARSYGHAVVLGLGKSPGKVRNAGWYLGKEEAT